MTITINGVAIQAKIQSNGSFSANFSTGKWAVGSYNITYSYGGSTTYAPVTATTKLQITYGFKLLFNNGNRYKAGSTIPISILLVDALGKNVEGTKFVVKAVGIAKASSPSTILPLPAGSSAGGLFTPDSDGDEYAMSLKTTGLTAGSYILYFTIAGDPVTHTITFLIA